jgi:cytosine/adenosine deaminase-related metal-dependent hydrolase
MHISRLAYLLAVLPMITTALPAQRTDTAVAFLNVNVIPMDRESVVADQTVIIRGGRIVEIGPSASVAVPSNAVRVEARSKYLIPGLAEMHGHIPGGNAPDAVVDRVLQLYSLNGITTVRGMLGHPRHLELRARAARNEILSPTIYTSGPSFNGNSVTSPGVGRQMVMDQKAAGYDLLKIHPGVSREAFDTIAATAQRLGIPFAGHVPLAVGVERALETRFASIDHLDGYVEYLVRPGSPVPADQSQFFGINLIEQIDESKLPGIVARTKSAGVWNVPTQILMENLAGSESADQLAARPEMRYWFPNQIEQWKNTKREFEQEPAARRLQWLLVRRQLIKQLHDAGAGLLLGSDAPQMWNVPGFSTHRELKALVDAGLTPFQALTTGTTRVAEYFGISEKTGTVVVGKQADLILLDANPLERIEHTQRIAGVVLRGRWIPKSEIDTRLTAFASP